MITSGFEAIVGFLALIGTIVGSVWWHGIWLSKQFHSVYVHMDNVKEAILKKLEYHEQHDDSRFNNIRNDLFRLQMDDMLKENRALKDKTIAQEEIIRNSRRAQSEEITS